MVSSPRHALLSNLTADLSVPDQPAFAMAIISPSEVGNPMQAKMRRSDLAVAGLAALGIVFGDIGTSPLYTLKTAFDFLSGEPTPERILGILSLLIWTLFLVTSIKYVAVAMSIDNDGEGGILALMALLGKKGNRRLVILVAGLLGAALIYGDGAITPAISVLSALEGLNIAAPSFEHYVVPAAVAILVLLFAAQPLGTSRIGAAFGPIMLLWFISIAALGLWGVAQDPSVFRAVNPYYAFHLLAGHGLSGFLVLGGIFLCVTGAEALYADMGHFGKQPIRASWSWIVFPCLVLNYAGQSAIALRVHRQQHFLSLVPRTTIGSAGLPRDCCHHYRQSINHNGRFLDDPAGHSARLVATAPHQANFGKRLRTDLCRRCQLAPNDRHRCPDYSIP